MAKVKAKYSVELVGTKDRLLEVFDILTTSGREIDANMGRKKFLQAGFVAIVDDELEVITFFAANELHGHSAGFFDTISLENVTINQAGTAYCADAATFLEHLKAQEDGKVTISINSKTVTFVDKTGHKSWFKQVAAEGDNGGKARIETWKETTIDQWIAQETSTGKYVWGLDTLHILMKVSAEEMIKVANSATLVGAAEYPISIKNGELTFSIESDDAGDTRPVEVKEIKYFEGGVEVEGPLDYEAKYHTGIDAAFSTAEGDVWVGISIGSKGFDMMSVNIDGGVFYLCSKAKVEEDEDDQKGQVEEEPVSGSPPPPDDDVEEKGEELEPAEVEE